MRLIVSGGKPAEPPEAGGDPGQPGHVGPGQDGGRPPHLPRVQEPRPYQPLDGVRRRSDDEVGRHKTGESAACAALRRLHDAAPETGKLSISKNEDSKYSRRIQNIQGGFKISKKYPRRTQGGLTKPNHYRFLTQQLQAHEKGQF